MTRISFCNNVDGQIVAIVTWSASLGMKVDIVNGAVVVAGKL